MAFDRIRQRSGESEYRVTVAATPASGLPRTTPRDDPEVARSACLTGPAGRPRSEASERRFSGDDVCGGRGVQAAVGGDQGKIADDGQLKVQDVNQPQLMTP